MANDKLIHRLLHKMEEVGASDLHIKIGSPPVLRVNSILHRVETADLTPEASAEMLAPIIPANLRSTLDDQGGIDFSHHESISQRFRCSVFHAGGGLHAAIRRVNPVIPDFEALNLPPIYEKLGEDTHEGLVIVCGVTGSGKSSTLAALINHINKRRSTNIITIEDPVEFLFQPDMSFISQREIGIDVPNFPVALRAAVRQDPDVLMIGEMRDRETMLAGIQAAETGHLVFVTLHTADTVTAFSRILEFFETRDHAFVRSSIAAGLRAVLAQRLLPTGREDIPRVPATEALLNSTIVADRIREGDDDDLSAIIAGSLEEGMHDFNSSLAALVDKNWVDLKIAERYSPNKDALRSHIRGIGVKADVLVSKGARS